MCRGTGRNRFQCVHAVRPNVERIQGAESVYAPKCERSNCDSSTLRPLA